MDALDAGIVDFRPDQNDGVFLATIVPWRTLLTVAARFLAGGCSLITSMVEPTPKRGQNKA
jgi:hypothetical protein